MEHLTSSAGTPEDRFQMAVEGALLLLLAALFLPTGTAEFAGVAAAGALLLALNVGRLLAGVQARWFSVTVGAWAVTCGVFALGGLRLNALAVLFLFLGIVGLGKAAFDGWGANLPRRRHAHG